MATAETRIDLVPTTTYAEKKIIQLDLDELEAKVLISILRRVGGCPENSYRKQADAILNSLMEVEELRKWNEWRASHGQFQQRVADGSINFTSKAVYSE